MSKSSIPSRATFTSAFWHAMACGTLCLSVLMLSAVASAQNRNVAIEAASPLGASALEGDSRLQRRIDISKEDERLDVLVADLAAQSNVHLAVVAGLSTRKISCRFE